MDSARDASTRLAYLLSVHPKLSHTFIAREIAALRALGVEVHTFSVRRTPTDEILSMGDRAEAAATTVLVDLSPAHLAALGTFVLSHPVAAWAGFRQALRSGGPGLRAHVWQLLYLGEALILARTLHARRLRHIHVHLANNAADVARLAVTIGSRVTGIRWTWSMAMHGPTEFFDVTRFDLPRKVEAAAFVACISDYCRSQLMAIVPTDQWGKLHVVRMGIDSATYRYADRQRSPDEPVRVLFVGRLVPEKAPQVLFRAVAQMPLGSTVLRVIGDGPLRGDLDALARQVNGGETIEVLGPVGQDDLVPQYQWADVFCLPSFAEGLPVVIMEAMATGLPVVTTAIAGIPELVIEGRTGLLVPAGRSDLIATALKQLRDAERRRTLGATGREEVLRKHLASENARILADLFAGYMQPRTDATRG